MVKHVSPLLIWRMQTFTFADRDTVRVPFPKKIIIITLTINPPGLKRHRSNRD